MTTMRERAAHAIRVNWHDDAVVMADAALLAALDPEDEALVALVADRIRLLFDASSRHVGEHIEAARSAICALRDAAQGETVD